MSKSTSNDKPKRKVAIKAKTSGKRVGKSKASKANNQLNRRIK